MPTPTDNYRNGYEEGKNRTLGSVAAEVMFAQMLRDDPGGHFKRGYQDAINGRPFAPSLQPTRSTPSSGRSPNFIEALLIGYFMAVFWIIKELVKAPFQLIGSLSRGEKPAVWVIVRNVIIVGLTVALTWCAHHVNEMQASSTAPSAMPASTSEGRSNPTVSTTITALSGVHAVADVYPTHAVWKIRIPPQPRWTYWKKHPLNPQYAIAVRFESATKYWIGYSLHSGTYLGPDEMSGQASDLADLMNREGLFVCYQIKDMNGPYDIMNTSGGVTPCNVVGDSNGDVVRLRVTGAETLRTLFGGRPSTSRVHVQLLESMSDSDVPINYHLESGSFTDPPTPSNYTAVIAGISLPQFSHGVGETITVNGSTRRFFGGELSQYAHLPGGGGSSELRVGCAQPYRLVGASSPSGNVVSTNDSLAMLQLRPGTPNRVSLDCKAPDEGGVQGQATALVGKWYPVVDLPPSRAGSIAYEFLDGGLVRQISYIDDGTGHFGEGSDREKLHWSVEGGKLTMFSSPEYPTRYFIVEVTTQTLILEEEKYHFRQLYRREPGVFPPFN